MLAWKMTTRSLYRRLPNKKLFVHFHGTFGKKDMVKMGCLRRDSETFLVLEAVIVEIEGVDAKRVLDPESGMVLLKV